MKDPFQYQGPACLPSNQQHGSLSGFRLGCVALFLIVSALPKHYYEDLVLLLASHLPGELCEINHSNFFVEQFRSVCIKVHRKYQSGDMSSTITALPFNQTTAWSAMDSPPLLAFHSTSMTETRQTTSFPTASCRHGRQIGEVPKRVVHLLQHRSDHNRYITKATEGAAEKKHTWDIDNLGRLKIHRQRELVDTQLS